MRESKGEEPRGTDGATGGLRSTVGYAISKVAGGEADGSKTELEGGVVPLVERRASVLSELLELLRDLQRRQKDISPAVVTVQRQPDPVRDELTYRGFGRTGFGACGPVGVKPSE